MTKVFFSPVICLTVRVWGNRQDRQTYKQESESNIKKMNFVNSTSITHKAQRNYIRPLLYGVLLIYTLQGVTVLQNSLLLIKSLNKTEIPIFYL